jgi:hypothetical protein
MAAAAVCTAPSRAEAFGLVNVEAQSVGTPVVASRVGGIPEIVRDCVTGYLVPPGDSSALAQAIVRLLKNGEAEQFGARAREHFRASFSLENIPRHASTLEELARLTSRPPPHGVATSESATQVRPADGTYATTRRA